MVGDVASTLLQQLLNRSTSSSILGYYHFFMPPFFVTKFQIPINGRRCGAGRAVPLQRDGDHTSSSSSGDGGAATGTEQRVAGLVEVQAAAAVLRL
jgi:hypothetical protein